MDTYWYLAIEKDPRDAAMNMAVDQHLLELMEAGALDAPVLRTYAWSRPTLSLGYHQAWEKSVDLDAVNSKGCDLVRRWTGGRAVLHDADELTYSVTAPMREPFGKSVSHNYRLLGVALARFSDLGVAKGIVAKADGDAAKARAMRHAPCFASLSESEIQRGDKKMIGSAQKLGKGAFLQHGSIPLRHRFDLLAQLTGSDVPMASLASDLAAHYADAGLALPSRHQLAERLRDAFAEVFQIQFRPLAEAGSFDENKVERIAKERFAADHWTFRK